MKKRSIRDAAKDRRLIEEWLPIAELSVESMRERTPMTPFPAPNRLHVWWARRPLVASRAAVLGSLLPEGADRERFLQVLGIHGDPVAARRRIEVATRKGERLGAAAYGYKRAFTYSPTDSERRWAKLACGPDTVMLDPTAGGGAIPFEAARLGVGAIGNDLNPVAALVERATVEWPIKFGDQLVQLVLRLGHRLNRRIRSRLSKSFPEEGDEDLRPDGYLHAHTVRCPYCFGLVPLSPNWRLASDGTASVFALTSAAATVPRIASAPSRSSRRRATSLPVRFPAARAPAHGPTAVK